MTSLNQTRITKDANNTKLIVTREFNAPLEKTWKAWTEPELLDQWWAPKPWKAKTRSMDFTDGGTWFYSMIGPAGEEHFCRADFREVFPNQSYKAVDAFTDEEGEINEDFPRMEWDSKFSKTENGTLVSIEITFASEEDLNKIVEMGFKEGFTAAHANLDELLAT